MANFLTMYASKSDAEYNGGTGINALLLPSPSYSSAKQTSSTLVNSGRSAYNGQVYAQRVGTRNLVKIEITWKYLLASKWAEIQQKILTGSEGFYVWIKFFDMESATWKCYQFYPGDRTATPFRLHPTTKEVLSWIDCTINFIDTGAEGATIA